MPRLMLSDELWSKLRMIMRQNRIYDKSGLRLTVEGILYRMRVGCPWRDLPSYFGKWNSVYKTFNYWSKNHKITNIFKQLVHNPELTIEFIDGSFIKAHQHSTGAAGTDCQDIGKSKGGNTTKIHMSVDANGKPIKFCLSPVNVNDSTMATEIIGNLTLTKFVVADKGYDSNDLRTFISNYGVTPVIPRKINSKIGNGDMNWGLYRLRHRVENVFARLKHFRAIATRYDKLARNYKSMVALACGFLWLPA
jgi:transposase